MSANTSLAGSEEHKPSAKMFNQETSNHAVVQVLLASPRGECEFKNVSKSFFLAMLSM